MTASSETDPFTVLGVSSSATPEQIRAAYLALAARYHPDRHHGNPLEELAAARMAEINRAYAILSEPTRRAGYTTGVHARAKQAATERQSRNRFFKGAVLMLAVPLLFRIGAVLIRALALLMRALLEETAALRGPRLAAVAALVALVVLGLALRRRARR